VAESVEQLIARLKASVRTPEELGVYTADPVLARQLDYAPYDIQPLGSQGLVYGPIELTRYAYSNVFPGVNLTRADLTAPAVPGAAAPALNMGKVLLIGVGIAALVAALAVAARGKR
jgi:hypothetical protein